MYIDILDVDDGCPLQRIPDNVGSGGSVDHLCDGDGCIEAEHCIPAAQHKTNVDRINCPGVGLFCSGDVITGVLPCQHAVKDAENNIDVESGCRRLYLLNVPEVYCVDEKFEDDFDCAVVASAEMKYKRRKM